MSGYSIQEGVEDNGRIGASLEEVARRFPDARREEMPDGSQRWCSRKLPGDELSLDVIVSRASGEAFLAPFVQAEAVRVYAMSAGGWPPAHLLFAELRRYPIGEEALGAFARTVAEWGVRVK